MPIETYLQAAPKAELHVHLVGTIQPHTVLTLAKRNNILLPADSEDDLRHLFSFRDFRHFADTFKMIASCLRTTEDYELVTYELATEMVRQHIRYAEVTFAPSAQYILGVSYDTYFSGLTRGRARARTELGVEINWIFDIVRSWKEPERHAPLADYTTAAAIEGKDDGVVALGLAGIETDHPPELFAQWFDRARAVGLHSAPHAGETEGAESIWSAIRILGAERIAHGVRAVEDRTLMTYLAANQIALDITPTSNICLGVFPRITDHVFPHLYAAGIPLTISSDDPTLFNTSLYDELALLVVPFRLPITAIDEILLNAVLHSFLPPERKREMEGAFRATLATLKTRHLLENGADADNASI